MTTTIFSRPFVCGWSEHGKHHRGGGFGHQPEPDTAGSDEQPDFADRLDLSQQLHGILFAGWRSELAQHRQREREFAAREAGDSAGDGPDGDVSDGGLCMDRDRIADSVAGADAGQRKPEHGDAGAEQLGGNAGGE